MTSISLNGVSKNYKAVTALETVDLVAVDGELLSLLGPSGCGKTTMLRVIAGLLDPTAGKIMFNDTVMNTVPSHKRNVGLVFQNYSLFPHMTVFQNVAFGLRMRGVDSKTIRTEVERTLEMVQLPNMGDRYPGQLSGGQQQRVGLARALVIKPAVLLLDEPFGALDKNLRESMQLELRQLQQRLKVTSIFVTHDQSEALTISDRIAVMNHGRVEQIDVPRVLYESPATKFVLNFLGASNSFPGKVADVNAAGLVVKSDDGGVIRSAFKPTGIAVGDNVLVACRPEKGWLIPEAESPDGVNCWPGVIKGAMYLGSVTHYYIAGLGEKELLVYQLNAPGGRIERSYQTGERVKLCWNVENTLVFKS